MSTMHVNLLQFWISPGHDFKGRKGLGRLNHGMQSMETLDLEVGKGIRGDRYFDFKPDYKGQITFFSEEVVVALESHFSVPVPDRSEFRRNALTSGLDLNLLIGKTFEVGGIRFSGSEECAPCFWMDEAITPGAFEWLKGRGGLRCRVLSSGVLSLGRHPVLVL